jgi:hypothetical protein
VLPTYGLHASLIMYCRSTLLSSKLFLPTEPRICHGFFLIGSSDGLVIGASHDSDMLMR